MTLEGLERAGSALRFDVSLNDRHAIRGTVVDEAGTPVAGVQVDLEEYPLGLLDSTAGLGELFFASNDPKEIDRARDLEDAFPFALYDERATSSHGRSAASGRTNADGSFLLEEVHSGMWVVRTAASSRVSTLLGIDVDGVDVSGIVLQSPRGGRLEGRFLAPANIDLGECSARIVRAPAEGFFYLDTGDPITPRTLPSMRQIIPFDGGSPLVFSIDASGRIRTPWLQEGEYRLVITLSDGSELDTQGFELEAGRVLTRDFDLASR